MKSPNHSLTTVVLGAPWAGTSTTYSIIDVLSSVGRDWEMLHGAPPRQPVFALSLLTLDGEPYRDANGRLITPDGSLADCPRADVIIVPDLHLDPASTLPAPLTALRGWITAAYAHGALVTSVCSGALLLAECGLLQGIEATTHWGYADMLRRLYPEVELRPERILVPAGDGHRLVTAGGASSWADLLLYLINRLAGEDEARRIAKLYLLEPHTEGQLCFASLATRRQHDDRLVADAQVWVAQHYNESAPVGIMARRSGLSERSFLRRFKRATGQSPFDYVQTLRVEEAKQMLEATDLPIDRIASEIGYSEPSSFRSAFRKQVGLSASVYRRKWRGMGHRQ